MDNKEEEVSQDAELAAEKFADGLFDKSITAALWFLSYESFIAGALYSKPFEHNAKPEDNTKPQNNV